MGWAPWEEAAAVGVVEDMAGTHGDGPRRLACGPSALPGDPQSSDPSKQQLEAVASSLPPPFTTN